MASKTTFGYYGVGDTNYDTTGGYLRQSVGDKERYRREPTPGYQVYLGRCRNLASRLDEKFGFGFTEIFTYDF